MGKMAIECYTMRYSTFILTIVWMQKVSLWWQKSVLEGRFVVVW